MSRPKIHLVDDEKLIHDIFKRLFPASDYNLILSENKSQALKNHQPDVDVCILDLMIPGSSGVEIFDMLKAADPQIRVIFLTAFGTIDSAIQAIQKGALEYMQKPFSNEAIKHKVDSIISDGKKRVSPDYRQPPDPFSGLIGISQVFQETLGLVKQLAASDSTILITGESGTGKELIARALYSHSKRRSKPYKAINSGNIPAALLESMLFGHRRGAFTGADRDKTGLFEEADGGVIFFDEVANLTVETQAKLLRVMQEKEILPLGHNQTIKVDVQVLAATNADLRDMVARGDFREDLFYRLNVFNIHLPPLRERRDDIPVLSAHFLKKFNADFQKGINRINPRLMEWLQSYHWPGNVRELENIFQRAVILCRKDELTLEHLPPELIAEKYQSVQKGIFNDKIDDFKKHLILRALEENRWIQKQAASDLGLNHTTLSKLIKRLHIGHP